MGVHAKAVSQRPSGSLKKRQRISEYTKFLLSFEAMPEGMAERELQKAERAEVARKKAEERRLSLIDPAEREAQEAAKKKRQEERERIAAEERSRAEEQREQRRKKAEEEERL